MNIKELLLDTIFPKNCFVCGEENDWFCEKCLEKLNIIKTQTCYLCNRVSEKGKVCKKCKTKSNLSGVLISCHYGGATREAIIEMKYHDVFDIAKSLSKLLINTLEENDLKNFTIIPIPLHPKKLRDRGYNQSALLAEEISKHFNWPINTSLKKIKYTGPQKELKARDRKNNLRGSFTWDSEDKISNVLLVDDVITTGATVEEVARILKLAGVKKIWAIAICRGDFKQI
ncbi:MAG: ComF family protein [Patescibacteria group bacterium]|jgi:ComF family protein